MIRRVLILMALLSLSLTAAAQTTEKSKTTPGKNAAADARAANDAEAERLVKERRANAQSLLISLAVDANTYSDQRVRARTQARIADALWEADAERGRTLFRRAWDAAEIADAEGQQRVQEDIRQQQAKSGSGGYVVASPPEIRKEVLRLASRRDRLLGEEFLEKLKEQEANGVKKRPGPFERDGAVGQRLSLARELLAAGDMERAMQFAAPVLGSVSMSTLDFLTFLREKNPAAADERYAAMLSIAAASPQSDANTASLLSSYIFTPHLYVMFVEGGSSSSLTSKTTPPIEIAPALRAAFFRTAGDILMRPLPQPGEEQANGAVASKYYVIKRMMPLFEQSGQQELAAGLRAQLEALSSMITEGQRQSQERTVREGIQPQQPAENREQSLLDRVDRAKTSAERDQLFYQLAMSRAESGDLKARDFADKIEDSELRHNVRAYVDASLAMRAVERNDAERALELARTGDLTHLQRVWIMTRAARLLVKTDRDRALQVLDDAMTEARRMDNSDADRPSAFFAVADALYAIDRVRGWDAASEAVKAANSAEAFTGEDGQMTLRMITKSSRSINQQSVPEFDVAGIFRTLAQDDYERTVALARVFEREAPRANAVLAIAQAIMENKDKFGKN